MYLSYPPTVPFQLLKTSKSKKQQKVTFLLTTIIGPFCRTVQCTMLNMGEKGYFSFRELQTFVSPILGSYTNFKNCQTKIKHHNSFNILVDKSIFQRWVKKKGFKIRSEASMDFLRNSHLFTFHILKHELQTYKISHFSGNCPAFRHYAVGGLLIGHTGSK